MTRITTQSGATLDPVAYGTMQWGGTADTTAAQAMFDTCLEAGITHFDTAYVYNGGTSEEILGALAHTRDDIFVATKINMRATSTGANIRASCDESRRRLQRDTIDLMYMHYFDDSTPLEDTFEALADLQSSGAIRYIGVSNFAAWQVMKAQSVASQFDTRIDALQPMLNLVKRQIEVEILPMTRDQGIQIYGYSPLGGGLLTGKYATSSEGRLAWMHEAAIALSQIAKDIGVDAATLAVAWVRHHAPDVHPILSARSVEQLAPSLAGMSYEMSADLYAKITALTPTPPPATDRIEEQ